MSSKSKHRKVKMSLRLKLALASIITLCTACCMSCFLVVFVFCYIYDKPITSSVAIIMCLIVCALTMIIGGIVLWHEALYITKPIIKINDGVQKVADGDFSVQLKFKKSHRKMLEGYYSDEIDELADNFNKMARELAGMDYMRKDFMSNVSHEIKTPVTAITGFSEILLDGGLNEEEQKEYLTYLNQESLRLSRLCDNMLRMSRLDNQCIVEKKQEVKVDEQIRHCIIMLSEKWSEKNINFELQLEKYSIISDYDLLFQVWTNLIDNAIKYSNQSGSIWISIGIEKKLLTVSIRDEGIGISKENLSKIFDKFYQCDESHKKQGSGLGLSIVKRIIELLDGKIECISEEGMGTTMTVSIPLNED
ncbi:MAG: integral rane sensor signal transduction histidine kinase [Herbinix sp.]|nr:integral rane sensor signal transduction histidine kinase [Herbinix sp.]